MLIIALTGSIGTGKSATARMFANLGVPVYDADAAVHDLYDKGGAAVAPVEAAFPGVARQGRIDRDALSARVLGDPNAIKRLEAIVHPLVHRQEAEFLRRQAGAGARMVVLEIPLLFETGGESRADAVVVTSVAADVQRQRVLERSAMNEEKYRSIVSRQLADTDKRRRAHFVVDTGHGFAAARRQVCDIVRALAAMPGTAWHRRARAAASAASN